jgi:uncharacterized repeat protein (TIGR03806 family)
MRPALLLVAAVALAACSSDGGSEAPDAAALPYAQLSTYGFFKGTGATQEPNAGVVPYTVNASLFADFADKHRFIVLPRGGKIGYQADEKWVFPVGTMIIKSFGYGGRLVETRVLIRQDDGWLPTTYLWNDAQTEATLLLTGAIAPVTYTDEAGHAASLDYRVPNQNQCFGCHGQRGATNVLGLRTRQLNRGFDYGAGAENQIDHMAGLAMFDQTPPAAGQRAALADPYGTAAVEPRARAWLEANCSHCHQPGGAAGSTNLYLLSTITTPIDLGVCRPPNAAGQGAGGRSFDVVAGHPEQSIMTFRIASTVPGIKMPEMPIQLVDQRGLDLISAWISGMAPMPCGQ